MEDKQFLINGTILRVIPNLNLKLGTYTEPSTQFVVVINHTKNGTPIVKPLHGETKYEKIMHWSKNKQVWRVYGHDTEIFK